MRRRAGGEGKSAAKTRRPLFSLDEVEKELFTAKEREEIHSRAREKVAAIRLQRLREREDVTQQDLAKRMGVSQASLSKLERRENVTLGSIVAYVNGLGYGLDIHAVRHDGDREELIHIPPPHRRGKPRQRSGG